MNHTGVRVFEHPGDSKYLPGPITVGRDVRLVPVGIAYIVEQRNRVDSSAQRLNTADMTMPPASHDVIDGQTYQHLPGHYPKYDLISSSRPYCEIPLQTEYGVHGGWASAAAPQLAATRSSFGIAPSTSHKRSYDEYREYEAPETQARSDVPDGWYKCGCCTSGWRYAGDDVETDDFCNEQISTSDDASEGGYDHCVNVDHISNAESLEDEPYVKIEADE